MIDLHKLYIHIIELAVQKHTRKKIDNDFGWSVEVMRIAIFRNDCLYTVT